MARIAALLLVACALRAQSVDGTLVDSVTRAPIPNVIVTLLGPSRYNDTTNETGAFHIPEVKPGKYAWNIVKAGYLLSPKHHKSFEVASDTRLTVEMDPLGKLEVRVRYPDGRPAPHAMVFLTSPTLGSNRGENADIGGRLEIEDLKPGSYILHAIAPASDPKPEGEIWATTWYPSTTDRASAEPIEITIASTLSRDLRLRSVPARHIRGVARDERGQPAAGVAVKLTGARELTAVTAADGAFDFLAHDGDWRLAATRKDGDVEFAGFTRVNVSRHDLENADVRLARPFEVPVVIDRDVPPGPRDRFPTMIVLTSGDNPFGFRPVPVEGAIKNVYPGSYTIQALMAPGGMYLESIKLGDLDATHDPVQIWDGSQPIRITYRSQPGTIRGVVEKGEGATVVVIAAGGSSHTVTAGRDGTFQLGGLAPGDYSVFAMERNDSTPFNREARWKPLLPRAERVHVDRGGTAVISLKLLTLP